MKQEDFNLLKKTAYKEITFNDSIEDAMRKSSLVPNMYQKYLDVYTREAIILKDLELELEKKYGERLEDIKQNSRIAWKNKEEQDSQIVRNEEYSNLRRDVERQEIIVSYLQECLGNINRMGFAIKNYIEIKKYMAGMN